MKITVTVTITDNNGKVIASKSSTILIDKTGYSLKDDDIFKGLDIVSCQT